MRSLSEYNKGDPNNNIADSEPFKYKSNSIN